MEDSAKKGDLREPWSYQGDTWICETGIIPDIDPAWTAVLDGRCLVPNCQKPAKPAAVVFIGKRTAALCLCETHSNLIIRIGIVGSGPHTYVEWNVFPPRLIGTCDHPMCTSPATIRTIAQYPYFFDQEIRLCKTHQDEVVGLGIIQASRGGTNMAKI